MSSSPGVPNGQSPIMDQLNAVDLSRLDTLLSLRQEQERLQTLKNKALEKADQVPPAVRTRVLADYERRFTGIEEQSAPLRAAARTEYRKIKALLAEVDRTRAGALERKQEAEFRHEVGEFDATELAKWLAEPTAVLEQCDAENSALNTTAQRFVDALGSEIEADDPAPAPAAPTPVAAPAPVVAAPAPAAPPPPVAAAPVAAPAPPPAPVPVAVVPPPPELPQGEFASETVITPMQAIPPVGAPPIPVMPPVPALPPLPPLGAPPVAGAFDETFAGALPDGGDATYALSREAIEDHLRSQTAQSAPGPRPSTAALVLDDEGEVHEYPLGPGVNKIGRADQNEIQIVKPGISRKHATVELTAEGYILRDLQSNNGTYVNGDRISEHLLANGDVVEVGPVRLVFHS